MSFDKNRQAQLQDFLSHCGLKGAHRTAVAGDASFRRYDRLKLDGKSYILMDAPPPEEDCLPFVLIAEHLFNNGFSAPEILQQDLTNGFLLLEDLKDDTFNTVFKTSLEKEFDLYKGSIDVLVSLHQKEAPKLYEINEDSNHQQLNYDEALFHRELDLFSKWYLPTLKATNDESWPRVLKDLWQPLEPHVIPEKPVMVLRDYHADNLMWLPDRKGIKQIGLLDFQDSVNGHPAYDMVSLLMDARRDVSPQLMDDMIDHYLQEIAGHGNAINEQEFLRAFHILGTQRNLKIIGIFARLWKRDKKPHYPTMIPHVWRLLERNLEHPALKDMKAWIDDLVSPEERTLILSHAELENE
jgi:hypothetical protein